MNLALDLDQLGSDERTVPAIYGEQVSNQLAANRKDGLIRIPSLALPFIEHGQIRAVSGASRPLHPGMRWICLLRCLEIGMRFPDNI